jgi:hypothetical protein
MRGQAGNSLSFEETSPGAGARAGCHRGASGPRPPGSGRRQGAGPLRAPGTQRSQGAGSCDASVRAEGARSRLAWMLRPRGGAGGQAVVRSRAGTDWWWVARLATSPRCTQEQRPHRHFRRVQIVSLAADPAPARCPSWACLKPACSSRAPDPQMDFDPMLSVA